MGLVTYKSWSPAGDLLSCLPGMRQIYRETGKKAVIMQRLNVMGHYYENAIHSTYDEEKRPVCMSKTMWEMLVPLLEQQEYIDHCEVWEGQSVDIDLDRMRENAYTPAPNGDLYHWQSLLNPQMATFLGEIWLTVPPSHNKFYDLVIPENVIINRTERYTNQLITYFFLKGFQDRLIFAGTEKEHAVFCKEWGLEIPRLIINNFLELAQAIQSCKFMIGNQSMIYHMAEGMGKKRLLEVFPHVANVWPHTSNGFPFMHNVTLEYYFNKFINE